MSDRNPIFFPSKNLSAKLLFKGVAYICIVDSLVLMSSDHQVFAVCKNGGGRSGSFYCANDLSVYLGRWRKGEIPDRNNTFCTEDHFE